MKTIRLLLGACALAVACAQASAQTSVNLTATDTSIAETRAGQIANPGGVRITRTGSTAAALTVWLKITGIAVRATDYTLNPNAGSFATIPAGSAQLDIAVVPIDDWLTEGTEALRIELEEETSAGLPVPYTIGGNDRVDLNLLDNEDPLLAPRVIVDLTTIDAVGTETVAGTDPAAFRISRSNNINVAIVVPYTIGGTATPGADFTPPPASATIPAGVAFVDVPIAPINDPLVESHETVTLTLVPHPSALAVPHPPEAYVLGSSVAASVTIVSEDIPPPPSVTITAPVNGSSLTVPNATPISLPITFTASDVNGHIVSYKIYDGTRLVTTGTTGYPTPPAPGTVYAGSFTMPNAYGGVHRFAVQATDNSGVIGYSTLVTTTVNYTYPTMTVTAEDAEAAEVVEGGTPNPAVFAITVDAPMPIDQYVFYRLTSPGPGLDFALPSSYSLTNWPINIFTGPTDYGYAFFPAGTTRVEIVVTPVDDLHLEGPETLTLTISYPFVIDEQTFEGIVQFTEGGFHVDPNAIPVRNFQFDIGTVRTATATILDNDTVPAPFSIVTLATTDSDAEETAPSATANPGVFTIARNGPTALPLTVNFAISAPPRPTVITARVAGAQNGIDFTAIGGSATIPAGATSVDVVIAPIFDLYSEPAELIQISLLPPTIPLPSPSSYMLGAGTVASLQIRDATLPAGTPIVRITAVDAQGYEDATAPSRLASFSVIRSGSITDAVTVSYTVSGSATNGVDYVTLPGSIVIPAGADRAAIVVNPIDDVVVETIESVSLILQTPPLDVEPPAYALGASTTMQNSAGVTIRDTYIAPLTRGERARFIRFGTLPRRFHVVVTRPPSPTPAPANAPAAPPKYNVEASTDLVNWEQIGTVDSGEEADEFVDVNAGDFEQRFYRFLPQPAVAP